MDLMFNNFEGVKPEGATAALIAAPTTRTASVGHLGLAQRHNKRLAASRQLSVTVPELTN